MATRLWVLTLGLGIWWIPPSLWGDDPPTGLERPIAELLAVGPDAAGVEKAQAAADALVKAGPKALPAILAAIPADDVVKANWLRVAFNRIVDDAVRAKSPLPTEELLAFAADKKQPGRSRRLALEAVEKVIPGTAAKLIDAGMDDPEFGPDAVALRMERAAAAGAKGGHGEGDQTVPRSLRRGPRLQPVPRPGAAAQGTRRGRGPARPARRSPRMAGCGAVR